MVVPDPPAQLADGDQRGHRGRADRLAALVDHEDPVGVAVEGQPDVGTVLDDGGLQVHQVGRVQRVGLVVGEGAVELEVHRHDVQRQTGQHDRDGVPAHPVAGVDDDLQRPDPRTGPPGRAGSRSTRRARPGADTLPTSVGSRSNTAAPSSSCSAQLRICGQSGVLPDRRGPRAAHLDAVVLRRVVAGGEHRPGQIEAAGGEVEHVGGAQTGLHDVQPAADHALGEGPRQRDRGIAHVVRGDHGGGTGLGVHELGEGRPDGPRDGPRPTGRGRRRVRRRP